MYWITNRSAGFATLLCVSSLLGLSIVALAGLSLKLIGFAGYTPVFSEYVEFAVLFGLMVWTSTTAVHLKESLADETDTTDAERQSVCHKPQLKAA